jgi:hypothetical protein
VRAREPVDVRRETGGIGAVRPAVLLREPPRAFGARRAVGGAALAAALLAPPAGGPPHVLLAVLVPGHGHLRAPPVLSVVAAAPHAPLGISIGAAPFRRDAPSRGSFFAAGAGLGGGRAARLGASTSVASAASSAASIAPSVVFALPSLSMRARFVTGLPSSARSFSPLLVCPCSPLLVSPCAVQRPAGGGLPLLVRRLGARGSSLGLGTRRCHLF